MKKTLSGFTLVELLVIISVIGILASITAVGMTKFQQSARDNQRKSDITLIAKALEKYYDKYGSYPSCASMTTDPTTVVTSTLIGLNPADLSTPGASSGTNSIDTSCSANPTINTFAYIPSNNNSQYVLKYASEFSGNIITVQGKRGQVSSCSNITGGAVTYVDSSGANPRTSAPYSSGYTIQTFASSGTLNVIAGSACTATVLLVGGGGGGGTSQFGGGGGGGQFLQTSYGLVGIVTVTVGVGGATGSPAGNGGSTTLGALTALGGGAGGDSTRNGFNGANGGGGSWYHTYNQQYHTYTNYYTAGGAGTNGYNGGTETAGSYDAAGGGGAGGAGLATNIDSAGGNGGNGLSSSISGNSVCYAGGGGGGSIYLGNPGEAIGMGTCGAGNGGGWMQSSTSGAANAGGGGGGGGGSGGSAGGSGIVIIKYPS